MKLYLISQNENNNYDTYDSAVVAAPDEETARNINPRRYSCGETLIDWKKAGRLGSSSWATERENVHVKYLGEAKDGTKLGVICASFNAG